ncbi:MAG: hydroxyacid dehydrogenase [Myxococcales bacterium]|nr:hydroxyacid dehydrogenase [Myxococcales bacterium]MCB9752498.1 hydroxyacid dehydrogenase [Myxococcales bacterium]
MTTPRKPSSSIVLIADKFSHRGVEALRGLVGEVVYQPGLKAQDLPAALAETRASILVVRSTEVTQDALCAGERLSLVIRAGAGVNTIDLATASDRGVFVANCPGKNAIAVAELTMGLMLALDRQLVDATSELRQGTWNKKKYGAGRGLKGQRLGLVGFGMIGREVAQRARAFALEIQVYEPAGVDHELAERYGVSAAPDLETLLRTSDIVSLHVPYSTATHHLIGRAELALMRSRAALINTSRGGVVDDAALTDAVKEGRVRAGLDVFEDEPAGGHAPFDSPLMRYPDVYATPHIGASTAEAAQAIAAEVVHIIRGYVLEGVVHNAVNVITDRDAPFTLVVRHLDRVGVLAGVLAALREEEVNVQDMHNVIFTRGEAACATITLESRPSPELLTRLREADEAILAVDLRG